MRLINTTTLELHDYFNDRQIPAYAILSHCWGEDEISLQEFTLERPRVGDGWKKILDCCAIARNHGLEWAWVDTCCIDKTSTAELQEAINSMYRWYERATLCYAFLSDFDSYGMPRTPVEVWSQYDFGKRPSDLSSVHRPSQVKPPTTEESKVSESKLAEARLAQCRWFSRGWALQELIAPSVVLFYDRSGVLFGSKRNMSGVLANITGIAREYLLKQTPAQAASVACRMSWASRRVTTRKEDLAYCLLGLFAINLPLIYGEGENAFVRLQEAIVESIDDQSIFAWTSERDDYGEPRALLARHPSEFRDSAHVVPTKTVGPPVRVTNRGFELNYPITGLWDLTMSIIQFSSVDVPAPAAMRFPLACRYQAPSSKKGRLIELELQLEDELHHRGSSVLQYLRVRTSRLGDPNPSIYRTAASSIVRGILSAFPGLTRYQTIYVRSQPYRACCTALLLRRSRKLRRCLPIRFFLTSVSSSFIAAVTVLAVSSILKLGIPASATPAVWALLTLGLFIVPTKTLYMLAVMVLGIVNITRPD